MSNPVKTLDDINPELRASADFIKCESDFGFFLYEHGVVEIRGIGIRPFKDNIWTYQYSLAEMFESMPRIVILKARQTGVSTIAMHFAYWLIRFGAPKSQHVLVLSKTKEDANYLLEKVPVLNAAQPDYIRMPVTTDRTQQFTLANGNTIECLASTESSGRSRAATAVLLDEHAFHGAAEKNWTALKPTLEGAGHFIVISTGNGQGNMYHDLYQQAKAQESEFKAIFISYDAVPHRDEEWREKEKSGYPLGEELFHQEYPRNDSEAFSKTGTCRFDVDWVNHQIELAKGAMPTQTLFEGRGRVFHKPITGVRYAAGLDMAQGLSTAGKPDRTSLKIFDSRHNHVASYEVKAEVEPGTVATELMDLLRMFNPFLVVERNGPGSGMIAALQALGYSNFYRFEQRHIHPDAKEEKEPKIGIQQTPIVKVRLVSNLTEVTNAHILTSLDSSMWHEFPTFVQITGTKWGAQGTAKDDQVIAAALASWGIKHLPALAFRRRKKKRVRWTG